MPWCATRLDREKRAARKAVQRVGIQGANVLDIGKMAARTTRSGYSTTLNSTASASRRWERRFHGRGRFRARTRRTTRIFGGNALATFRTAHLLHGRPPVPPVGPGHRHGLQRVRAGRGHAPARAQGQRQRGADEEEERVDSERRATMHGAEHGAWRWETDSMPHAPCSMLSRQ